MKYQQPSINNMVSAAANSYSGGFEAAHCRLLNYTTLMAIANFSAENPLRWRVLCLAYFCPELSQRDIADRVGVEQATVSRYLTQSIPINTDFYAYIDHKIQKEGKKI